MSETRSIVDRTAEINANVEFFPMPAEAQDGELPMVRIAGCVDVFTYVDSAGVLRVSVHTDGPVEEPPEEWAEEVPMIIKVNDDIVAEF
jgi:hypothetical protein